MTAVCAFEDVEATSRIDKLRSLMGGPEQRKLANDVKAPFRQCPPSVGNSRRACQSSGLTIFDELNF
jgi:hypothetical protein